jgi:hypothetical protein
MIEVALASTTPVLIDKLILCVTACGTRVYKGVHSFDCLLEN